MLHKSIKYPLIYGKFTYWVYAELIALLPLILYFRESRHIAYGILQNKIIYMICDTIIHWGPFIILL